MKERIAVGHGDDDIERGPDGGAGPQAAERPPSSDAVGLMADADRDGGRREKGTLP